MKELTPAAQTSYDSYISKVRARLACSGTLDASEIEADILEHIMQELGSVNEPVEQTAMDSILERLGPPEQWVPDEELIGWHRILLRLKHGPDDWRLAYISFTLFIVGFITQSYTLFPIFLLFSLIIARGAHRIGNDEKNSTILLSFPLITAYGIFALSFLFGIPAIVLPAMADAAYVYPQAFTQQWAFKALAETLIITGLCWISLFIVLSLNKCKRWLLYPYAAMIGRKLPVAIFLTGVAAIILGIAGLLHSSNDSSKNEPLITNEVNRTPHDLLPGWAVGKDESPKIPNARTIMVEVKLIEITHKEDTPIKRDTKTREPMTPIELRNFLRNMHSRPDADIVSMPQVHTKEGQVATLSIPSDQRASGLWTYIHILPTDTPDKLQLNFVTEVTSLAANGSINTRWVDDASEFSNGESIVFRGIYSQDQSLIEDRNPLTEAIPAIGKLLSKVEVLNTTRELIIIASPTIVDPKEKN